MDFIDVFELHISNMKFNGLRDIIKDIIKKRQENPNERREDFLQLLIDC